MLETLMTSKVRTALMKHFLGHPQERFYLRQLERLLQLPLTPARRELIRLTKMGLLKEEQEANLRFFRLNDGFAHLEDLKKLVGLVLPASKTYSWLAPVFGLITLLMVLQVGLFYIWTHPVEDLKLEATDSYVMSSGKARLESGGFGGW